MGTIRIKFANSTIKSIAESIGLSAENGLRLSGKPSKGLLLKNYLLENESVNGRQKM